MRLTHLCSRRDGSDCHGQMTHPQLGSTSVASHGTAHVAVVVRRLVGAAWSKTVPLMCWRLVPTAGAADMALLCFTWPHPPWTGWASSQHPEGERGDSRVLGTEVRSQHSIISTSSPTISSPLIIYPLMSAVFFSPLCSCLLLLSQITTKSMT